MPTEELLTVQGVILNVSLSAIISRHGHRVVCEECGEDVINEREVKAEGQIQCRACAGGAYYEADEPCPLFEHTLTTEIFSMKAA